jgi:rubrerythrin/uncharacterized tellurite resistance protein B-like protein/uncharacterized membrane protein
MQKNRIFWRRCSRILTVALILLIVAGSAALFARAGGAGGSSSSGGSSGGGDGGFIIYLIIWMFRVLGPVPTLIILVVVAVGAMLAKHSHDHSSGNAIRNIPAERSGNSPGQKRFLTRNPDFDEDAFKNKVRTAFLAIQKAWSDQDISPVRRYISDGVYQRFSTQFEMMRLLKQKNTLSDIQVRSIFFESFEEDGDFSVIHVGIQASINDHFVCEDLPGLNSGGRETFTEFWSFIRRGRKNDGSGQMEKAYDMYSSNNCPKCDAPLPEDMGERGQCPYCDALVNSGEYDWVLAEISQADDYGAEKALKRRYNMTAKATRLKQVFPDFSVQHLEDIASNAFFQIMTAITRGDSNHMRRFTSDKAYGEISKSFPSSPYLYNRLFLNYAVFIGAHEEGEFFKTYVAVKFTAQRIQLKDRRLRILDPSLMSEDRVMVLKRKMAGQGARGSALMHQCAACGGPIADSTDVKCQYCGAAYNTGELEWVVDDYMTRREYQNLHRDLPKMKVKMDPNLLESLYDVRDYVINNLMVMVAADGVLAPEEEQFLNESARKLGYKLDNIQPLFAQAKAGRLSIRMPLDISKRRKIIDLMRSAAEADGNVSSEERQLLDALEQSYLRALDAGGLF